VTEHTPEDEAALEATRAPLMDHLLELRKRLVYAMSGFAVCFVISFAFSTPIFNFLARPLHAATNHLIYTALPEYFFTQIKIGAFGGLVLGFPVIASQIWMFVAPGLYRQEKRAFLPFLLWTPVLFLMGASFVYFVMLPLAINFFGGYQAVPTANSMGIELEAKVSEYLDLVMTLIIAFGLTFQLPVVLSLLGKVGIVTSQGLKRMRRFAIVGLFGIAAIFTPPDAVSMLSLAVPLVLLYEISIFCVKMIERTRAREEAARRKADGSGTDVATTDGRPDGGDDSGGSVGTPHDDQRIDDDPDGDAPASPESVDEDLADDSLLIEDGTDHAPGAEDDDKDRPKEP
jgi:sec-independent protein translocase protein TatC